MSKREKIIDEVAAKAQLDLFFDWYDIDFDEMYEAAQRQQGAGLASVEAARKRLIKLIREGRLEFIETANAKNEPVLKVHQVLDLEIDGKKSVVYNELTGRIRAALPSEGGNGTAKMYRLLAMLSGESDAFFLKLRRGDIGVADMIGFLFLLV